MLLFRLSVAFALVAAVFGHHISDPNKIEEELRARRYVDDLNTELNTRKNIETEAEWAYASNITDENEAKKTEISSNNAEFAKIKAKEMLEFDYKDYHDDELKRMLKKLTKLGYASLSTDKYKELLKAINQMESNYAKIKICSFKETTKCDLALEPEITEIMSKSRNPEELKYYWEQWYDRAGAPTRENFQRYIDLANEASLLNNFTSKAESWLSEYEDDTFEDQLVKIFEQFSPFYMQLHGYVRNKLRQFYGPEVVPEKGAIPMHLLGNMWAQSWEEIADLTTPYPEKQLLDVTEEMVRQGYTANKLFEMGDQFFQSLNMTKLPKTFWEKSILEKPTDGRELICHASAWDFYKPDDVRIKQCTRINMDQLFVAHHELGHIQYYLQYAHQPSVFREGANPGFHEAVGDVLSLSVSTPKHLAKIGLLKDYEFDKEAQINQLYRMGLEKLVFLPFAYTLDKYRWGIFRGEIKSTEYNKKFWEMREKYSGIKPPMKRTENDFDAPAKYHVSADIEYLRYLVSFIVQFQFHKSACEKAGEYVPNDPEKTLFNCDIYQSSEAGNALKAMLSLGSSKPWPEAMEVLTGERKMSADALLEYFKPLQDWLAAKNAETGVHIGWEKTDSDE